MNHYPEVASFVRDRAHVERYTNLKVKYIDHHNPDLVLLAKDGSETHRVDLTRLSSTHSIHKLCQLLGLKEICRDENGDCRKWASSGECERNPDFMSLLPARVRPLQHHGRQARGGGGVCGVPRPERGRVRVLVYHGRVRVQPGLHEGELRQGVRSVRRC